MATTAKARHDGVVGAGAAGGGVGTLVVAVANSLPAESVMRALLTFGAPLLTVCSGGIWLFIKVVWVDPYVFERKNRALDASMDRVIADARANAARILADPNASAKSKTDVQKLVEEAEQLRLKKITERLQIISAQ